MTQIEEIKQLITPVVSQQELSIYSVRFTKLGHQRVLEILLMDKEGQLTLEQAETVTQSISELLDSLESLGDEYLLDIGSPGAERELRTDEEIIRSVSRYVYVKFKNPIQGADSVYGTLISVDDEYLQIEYQVKQRKLMIQIPKENIAKVRLAVKF
ncbi:MAG: ribosome maturation factor RimP [Erysipelothrix sp.]|nr:ribosome maturation factor RimP [Erysipelothrix sp.]